MKYFLTLVVVLVQCFSASLYASSLATMTRQTLLELPYDANNREYYVGGNGQHVLDIQMGKGGGGFSPLNEGKVRSFSLLTGQVMHETPFSVGSMRNSILLADGTRLFVDREGRIGKFDFTLNKAVQLKPAMPGLGDYDDAYNLYVSKDEKSVFITQYYSSEITEFDVTTLQLVRKFSANANGETIRLIDNIREITFAGKRALAISVSIDVKEEPVDYRALIIMDLDSARNLQVVFGKELGLKMCNNFNRSPRVSPLGDRAIFCEADRGCKVVDLQTKKAGSFFMKDGSTNGSAAFSPDGKLVFLQENEKISVLKASNLAKVSSRIAGFSFHNEAILLERSNTIFIKGFSDLFFFSTEGKLLAKVNADGENKHHFLRDSLILEDRQDGLKLLLINSAEKVELVEIKL